MWVLQHYSVHAFDMSTIIVFVHLGFQVNWNQFSSNNSHHTSCIHKGSHAGKWPDLMTSKPDSVSTLGYHRTYHTGRPLEPQVHWDATGTTLADASTQWCSSGYPVLICIIGTHWKTTGKPLEDYWKTTGSTLATKIISPVAFQCTLGSKCRAHWTATGLPLEDHWLRVRESVSHTSKSILVHTMARCRQATRHYLNQYGPRHMMLHASLDHRSQQHYTSTCFIWLILIQWDNFAVADWKHQGMVIA